MDLDALVASMKREQYGAEPDPEPEPEDDPTEVHAADDEAKGHGIWKSHIIISKAILQRGVRNRADSEGEGINPVVEAVRWKAVRTLQQRFERMCERHLGEHWNPSFESWLFARRQAGPGGDPLLPSGETAMRDAALEEKLIEGGCSRTAAITITNEMGKASRAAARTVLRAPGGHGKPVKFTTIPGKDRIEVKHITIFHPDLVPWLRPSATVGW